MSDGGRLVRVAERERARIAIRIDGRTVEALTGDTLLTAILLHRGHLRHSEFGDGPRAGFCLMGACQDCWVRLEDGRRLRACTTLAADGLAVETGPDSAW